MPKPNINPKEQSIPQSISRCALLAFACPKSEPIIPSSQYEEKFLRNSIRAISIGFPFLNLNFLGTQGLYKPAMRVLSAISVLFITALIAEAKAGIEIRNQTSCGADSSRSARASFLSFTYRGACKGTSLSAGGLRPLSILSGTDQRRQIIGPFDWNTINHTGIHGADSHSLKRSGYPPYRS